MISPPRFNSRPSRAKPPPSRSGVTGQRGNWTFIADGVERHVRLNSRFTASNVQGCRAVAHAGGGITLLSEWNVAEDLAHGRLVRVELADAAPEPINIWAVYSSTRLLPQKVRVFITELRAALTADGMNVTAEK